VGDEAVALDRAWDEGYPRRMFVRSTNKQSADLQQRPADGAAMRSHNVGLVLRQLVRDELVGAGELSRADLARVTGLARSTVSTIVSELIEAALVSEGPATASRGGRPPIALRVERDRYHIIGVELGASHVTVVRTDLLGGLLGQASADHPVQSDPEGSIRLVAQLVEAVCPAPLRGRVLGLGLAVPSPLDPARPGLLSDRILPAWAGVQPGERLHALLNMPIFMENDANLGVLAESWWGAGVGLDDFAYIKVATGVGAGLFINGAIYRGASGLAGEIGHTAIDPAGPRCRCGLNGCLEAMIGSGALAERARQSLASHPGTRLRAAALDLPSLIAAAHDGDPLAGPLIGRAGFDLGVAIANLLNLLNPGVVVLGGTLASAGEALLGPLRLAMADRSLFTSLASTAVLLSPLGDEAIALGAAGLVLQQALDAPERMLFAAQANAAR
jgi:predicted NBD/HSP70 family sugar kinase